MTLLSTFVPHPELFSPWFALAAVLSVAIGIFTALSLARPSIPAKAPKLVQGSWPIVGSLGFFKSRWDFFNQAAKRSATGNFSFYVGRYHVVGVSGDAGRKAFFESRALNLAEGWVVLASISSSPKSQHANVLCSYGALFAGSPGPQGSTQESDSSTGSDFMGYFAKRLTSMLKQDLFQRGEWCETLLHLA